MPMPIANQMGGACHAEFVLRFCDTYSPKKKRVAEIGLWAWKFEFHNRFIIQFNSRSVFAAGGQQILVVLIVVQRYLSKGSHVHNSR